MTHYSCTQICHVEHTRVAADILCTLIVGKGKNLYLKFLVQIARHAISLPNGTNFNGKITTM